jgi:formate dehydrogenase alpha subunit
VGQEITINIDGHHVKTTSDKMVIQAASEAGIYVPYLCYYPGMKPFGACRMCVVEVEGAPGTPASCTLPVRDGMVVSTQTTSLKDIRRGINELLVAEHPQGCLTCHRVDLCGPQDICLRHVGVNDRCVTCPKNERCEFKDTTRYMQMELNSPLTYQYRNLSIETKDPFYDRDYNLCIVCVRCVRVCDEVRGDTALAFTERAGQALVGTVFGSSLLESGCEFCGACLDVCPVGALVERDYKWEKAVRVERSVCQNCPVGCQINYEVNKRGKVIRAIPELNAPVNKGQACYKGKFGFKYVNDKRRLHQPLIRDNGVLKEASWQEALDLVARRFPHYRGNRFSALLGSRNTNEEAYLLQKFTRTVMSSNNVDVSSNTRPELIDTLRDMLGYSGASNPIRDLRDARCILTVATNITEEHNVLAVPIKQAVKDAHSQLIVIDPREVELTRYAHIWLRPYPSTEGLVVTGMVKVIFDENLLDQDFIEQHFLDTTAVRESIAAFSLDDIYRSTGVPATEIQEAARKFAENCPATVLVALDNIWQPQRASCVTAIGNLLLSTGNFGKPSSGIYPLPQGTNELGSWDVGCVPHLLPGYVRVDDRNERQRLNNEWGTQIPETSGLGVAQSFEGARDGRIKAMLIFGDHANFSNGLLGDVDQALESLEFLVVCDSFLTSVTKHADVVLPVATWAEKDGTYTNLERRVQALTRVIEPIGPEIRPEWQVLCELATRMGVQGFGFDGPQSIMEEIARVSPLYGGISHTRLQREVQDIVRPSDESPLPTQVMYSGRISKGLQWPCPDESHLGTPTLYADGFGEDASGFKEMQITRPAQFENPGFPLMLVPGRILVDPRQEMQVVEIDGLNRIEREEYIEIHPKDAELVGVSEGDQVNVVVLDGCTLRASVRLAKKTLRGLVYHTALFGDMVLRLDSSEDPDPMNKVPGLVVVPVNVEKISQLHLL